MPFGWDAKTKTALPHDVAAVVDADLARSGRFLTLPKKDFLATPHQDRDVTFKDWRLLKAEALVIGSITPAAAGKVEVQFRLYDVFREKQLAGYSYTVSPEALRGLAHQIADVIYEKLTGEPGAFNTRIAYVTHEAPRAPGRGLQAASGGFRRLQPPDRRADDRTVVVARRGRRMAGGWPMSRSRTSAPRCICKISPMAGVS